MSSSALPTRRFGRTEIAMPVLSLGGMRFQQSWTDLAPDAITGESTSPGRHSGPCGAGWIPPCGNRAALRQFRASTGLGSSRKPDASRILQTKVALRLIPRPLRLSWSYRWNACRCNGVDLLAIHGINRHDHLEQTIRPGGCLDVVRRWQAEGRIGHVGFSTHGEPELIVDAIETDCFDYVNLHWYFIRQDNEPAIAQPIAMTWGCSSSVRRTRHLHTPGPRLRMR